MKKVEDYNSLYRRLEEYRNNKAIDETSLITLLICYAILIITGVVGNGLVCMAVIRKPSMRTARNVYIINLAVSDLFLCLFTMPFSLVEIAYKFWPLGKLLFPSLNCQSNFFFFIPKSYFTFQSDFFPTVFFRSLPLRGYVNQNFEPGTSFPWFISQFCQFISFQTTVRYVLLLSENFSLAFLSKFLPVFRTGILPHIRCPDSLFYFFSLSLSAFFSLPIHRTSVIN